MVLRMLKRVFFPIALTLLVFLSYSPASGRQLFCESIDGQSRYCRADTKGGVRLVRQLSKSDCHEGRTWGYDRRGVWVAGGCRAQFELGGTSPYPPQDRRFNEGNRFHEERQHRRSQRTLTCESWGGRPNYCRAPVNRGHVQIERQLSSTRCRMGENWGWDRGGIWVKKGCRAVFSIY